MHKFLMIAATAALAGCNTAPPAPTTGLAADQRLQTMLAGLSAGQAIDCVPEYRAGRPSLVTPGAIAFQVDPGLVYVSNVEGSGCEDLANPNFAMVTKSNGPGMCSGDTVKIVDTKTRILHGACTFSQFVPYRR